MFVCLVVPFGRCPSLYMHSFRGKLRVVTSPNITFGADEVSSSKEVLATRVSEIRPSGLSPGVLIRPAPLRLCALCIDTVRGVPQIRRLRGAPLSRGVCDDVSLEGITLTCPYVGAQCVRACAKASLLHAAAFSVFVCLFV